MKVTLIVCTLLLALPLKAEEVDERFIDLGDGIGLKMEGIAASRNVPYRYFDQAMESIPEIYPEGKILTKRRTGELGRNTVLRYSLVAYTKSPRATEVSVGGSARSGESAWIYLTAIPIVQYTDKLVVLIEAISENAF